MRTTYLMAAAMAIGLAGTGQAATLNFLGLSSPSDYDPTVIRGTLDCLLCAGLNSNLAGNNTGVTPTAANATGFSGTTFSDLFSLPNSNDTTETAFVNAVTGGSFGTGAKTVVGGGNKSFTSSALYIFFKIGTNPDVTVIKNTGLAKQDYSWIAFAGKGAGLSHYVEYGSVCQSGDNDCNGSIDVPAVPVPAAGWLLAGALGGLAALRRRRGV